MYQRVTPVPTVITVRQGVSAAHPAAVSPGHLILRMSSRALGVTVADEAASFRTQTSYDADPVFVMHRGGKIGVEPTVDVPDRAALAMAYTPGVARVCSAIADQPELAGEYTWTGNTVAVVSDGTAVLGLGDIGPAAAMPVMEGKALLFKKFAGINAVPICIDVTDVDAVVAVVTALAPSFGGINLEDISAPRCFEIEDRLRAALDIPVMHDDQHGTAIVALAALRSAGRVVGKELGAMRAVVCGAGRPASRSPRSCWPRASAKSAWPTARA